MVVTLTRRKARGNITAVLSLSTLHALFFLSRTAIPCNQYFSQFQDCTLLIISTYSPVPPLSLLQKMTGSYVPSTRVRGLCSANLRKLPS